MYKFRTCLTLIVAIPVMGILSQSAMAVSLSGTLMISPVVRTPIQITKPNGKVITRKQYVSGSYFAMGANNPNGGNVAFLAAGTAGGVQLGNYQNFVTNPDIPHPKGWNGNPKNKAGAGYKALVSEGSAFSPFSFFSAKTYIGLNPISYQSADPAPAPTANIDMSTCVNNACSMTADLSAWEVYWNGSVFQQGPRPVNSGPFGVATGVYNLASKSYSLDWVSQIKGGPFGGVTGYWHIEGKVSPVPVPAALWLFGSGLLGLAAAARRKKNA